MVMRVSELQDNLKKYKLSKKNIALVLEIIEKQIFLYKKLKMNPDDVSLYIVNRKMYGINTIRIFEHNNILIEELDNSYNNFKVIQNLKDSDFNFLFKIEFLEDGHYVDITQSSIKELRKIHTKKVKSMTYGVISGNEVLKIDVLQVDVKGTETEVIQNIVKYAFKKKMGHLPMETIDCLAIGYC